MNMNINKAFALEQAQAYKQGVCAQKGTSIQAKDTHNK